LFVLFQDSLLFFEGQVLWKSIVCIIQDLNFVKDFQNLEVYCFLTDIFIIVIQIIMLDVFILYLLILFKFHLLFYLFVILLHLLFYLFVILLHLIYLFMHSNFLNFQIIIMIM